MEVISIERSTYEELLTSFNSFVVKMKEMASRGNDKGLGDWLDNQDVCQILNISPRTLQTLRDITSLRMWREFCILWMVEIRMARCVTLKQTAYERIDNAA